MECRARSEGEADTLFYILKGMHSEKNEIARLRNVNYMWK